MKQSTSKRRPHLESNLPSFFGEEEIGVAETLLNLSNLINKLESPSPSPSPQFQFRWGGKRKRSAMDRTPSPSPLPDEREKKKRLKVKRGDATSPSTPLDFSPSETDDKSKHSSLNKSSKKRRERLMEEIERLTQRGEVLRREVDNVKTYYNKVNAFNLELKAKKQELETTKSLYFGLELSQSMQSENQHHLQIYHQQPFNVDQTVNGSQAREKFQYPYGQTPSSSGSGLGKVNNVGPLVGIDLNVAAEETFGVDSPQPLDRSRDLVVVVVDRKAQAAEARRRRMAKIREMKNSFGSTKPRR